MERNTKRLQRKQFFCMLTEYNISAQHEELKRDKFHFFALTKYKILPTLSNIEFTSLGTNFFLQCDLIDATEFKTMKCFQLSTLKRT